MNGQLLHAELVALKRTATELAAGGMTGASLFAACTHINHLDLACSSRNKQWTEHSSNASSAQLAAKVHNTASQNTFLAVSL